MRILASRMRGGKGLGMGRAGAGHRIIDDRLFLRRSDSCEFAVAFPARLALQPWNVFCVQVLGYLKVKVTYAARLLQPVLNLGKLTCKHRSGDDDASIIHSHVERAGMRNHVAQLGSNPFHEHLVGNSPAAQLCLRFVDCSLRVIREIARLPISAIGNYMSCADELVTNVRSAQGASSGVQQVHGECAYTTSC